ncbi:MAG TPA: FAD-dependent oxidoreductase [Chitinophagaceae bacterium]|nr:FAD-dependent oxidoreductase [Chitinophagaceae bacterium]
MGWSSYRGRHHCVDNISGQQTNREAVNSSKIEVWSKMKYDVIIIGAGASGLAAMRKLVQAGLQVCMLEASHVTGGRIATIDDGFGHPVEAGAEFVHGKLPLTFKLIKEAKLRYEPVHGKMIGVQNGEWQKDEHDTHWDGFMGELKKLKRDITVQQFLDEKFYEGEYLELRRAVQRFAEGFNLADITKASALSLKDEWKNIDKTQFRITGGYGQVIKFLYDQCAGTNADFYFNTVVNKINYEKNVVVYTTDRKKYESWKLIITVSTGVLQSGSIQFDPPLTRHGLAIQSLGFGGIIKFLLEFKTRFWESRDTDIGFILTDEIIPTWWTQLPAKSNLLTAWMGGTRATENIFETNSSLLQTAMLCLSSIFKIAPAVLRDELRNYKIVNWLAHPFVKGGYSYNTLYSREAKEILSSPVDDKIYFAGEAVSNSESQGTVESALHSGYNVAELLLKQ